MKIWIIAGIGIMICCALAFLWLVFYVSRLLEHMDNMLTMAMEDTFEEQLYDESKISRLETKLAAFLADSRLSKQRLKQERDNIQQMVSDMSHQTKMPITNILMYTELLEEMAQDKQEKEVVKRIAGQTERLQFLIQSLIKISQLENGLVAVNPKKQEIIGLLQDMKDSYEKEAAEKEICYRIHTENVTGSAVYDYKWTREAIGNIVDNALKYTTPGGCVDIRIQEYEMFLAVEIADTGIGIAEEEQAKVFSRFYRGREVNQCDGVGIGLYLARRIIRLEGGYIKLISEVGKGSRFLVYLEK